MPSYFEETSSSANSPTGFNGSGTSSAPWALGNLVRIKLHFCQITPTKDPVLSLGGGKGKEIGKTI